LFRVGGSKKVTSTYFDEFCSCWRFNEIGERRNFRAGRASTLHQMKSVTTSVTTWVTTLRIAFLSLIALLATAAWIGSGGSASVHGADATPVLVELFTSEGCSSCPPADRFLQKLDAQPIPGAQVIVLSEHVDYWNHIGWKDPYSDHSYSERQSTYAQRFGLGSIYTPQMVVDGSSEFNGSDSALANKAFAKVLGAPTIPVRLSSVSTDASNILHAHIEIGSQASTFGSPQAEVYVAVALNRVESQVSSGENAGHRLAHVSVVKSLTKVGALNQGQVLARNVQLKLEPGSDFRNLRLIAFVQEPRQGRVLGAASMQVSAR
jgi:hypothetical protein